jgi:hypothetical protein
MHETMPSTDMPKDGDIVNLKLPDGREVQGVLQDSRIHEDGTVEKGEVIPKDSREDWGLNDRSMHMRGAFLKTLGLRYSHDKKKFIAM